VGRDARLLGHTEAMLQRIESFIRERGLIEPGGEVTCLVSGGADSTCLWHGLGELGYRVSSLHVAHGLRGAESDEDARFCREAFGAEVVEAPSNTLQLASTEAELRDYRYSFATDRLRATGHTASDQVESVLLGLVASGSPQRIKARREDGVVRPLLGVWREEVRAWCDERGLPYREDSSNASSKRGLIRDQILPLLERLDPRARASLLALADERPLLPRTLERTLAELLAHREGSEAADLGGGVRAVREYGTLRLEGVVTWGPWTLESDRPGLAVRGRRRGDHLAGRRKKVQDLFVDAKVPRSERDSWPVVVHGEDVVAVPGVAEAPGWEGAVTWRR
jgi:tRNA(Ile)-lysidine synthase